MSGSVRLFLLASVAALMILGGYRVFVALQRRDAAAEAVAIGAVPVEVLKLGPRALVDRIEVSGTLRAINDVDVVADLPGRVQDLNVEVGSVVTRGQVLARLESEDMVLALQQAEAGLAMARAGLETAAADLTAAEAMATAGGVSGNQIIALKARKSSAEAQVKQAEAAVGLGRSRVSDTSIRSPIAGVVTRNMTKLGRMAAPGYPLFTVQDQSAFEMVLAVDERGATQLRPGQSAEVLTSGGARLTGTVRTVASSLDPNTRKAEVLVVVPSPGEGVMANSTATVRIELATLPDALAVPDEAIVGSQDAPMVYVVREDAAHKVPVRLGAREQGWTAIEGVEPGEAVVVSGQHLLSEGAQVKAVEVTP